MSVSEARPAAWKQPLTVLVNPAVVVVAVSYGLLHTVAAWFGLVGSLVPVAAFAALAEGFELVLRGVLWLSTWRYAYTVLRSIAQGHRDLPVPGVEAVNPFAELGLVVHFLALPVAAGVLASLDPVPELVRWSLGALVAALIPASAAVMAMTGRFALAFSPWHLGGFLARVGGGYARLLASSALVGAAAWGARLLPWPGPLAVLVPSTLAAWACLAVFALTGALIREHRTEFAIPGELEPAEERDERDRVRERRRTLDTVYASLRGGVSAGGYAAIDALLAAEDHNLDVYNWLFDSMREWDSKAPALEMGRRYVDRLLDAGAQDEALAVAAQCRRMSERFAVTAESARPLAAYARSIGRVALAENLEAGLTRGSGA